MDFPAYAALKNWSVCQDKNETWITCLRTDSAAILFYTTKGGKPSLEIPILNHDSSGKEIKIGGYLAISPDSILVLVAETKIILLLNKTGNVMRTYEVNIPLQGNITEYCLVSTSASPMLCDGKNIYVTSTRLDLVVRSTEARKKYFSTFPEICISLQNGTAQNLMGHWPELYSRGDAYRDFYPQRCIDNHQRVYGFAATDSLFSISNSGSVVNTCPSKLLDQTTHPYPDDSLGNFSFLERYDVTESRYLSFSADPFRGYYYRVFQQGITYEKPDGLTVNDWLDKPWKLMVLDNHFESLGSIDFDPAVYLPSPLVVKEGILVHDRKKETGAMYWDLYTFSN